MTLPYQLGCNWSLLDYPPGNTNYQQWAQALGMKYFRCDAPWNYSKGSWPGLELTPGTRNATAAAQIAALGASFASYGIKLIVVVDGQLLASYSSGIPVTPAQFAATMGWLVGQCPGLIWELINEPDQYQYDATAITPAVYTSAIQQAYTAMKAADPTCTVLAGCIANLTYGGSGYNFWSGCYGAGIKGSYDVASFHNYPYVGSQPPATGQNGTGSMTGLVGTYAGLRSTNTDATPCWCTETGWQSQGTDSNGTLTQNLQAIYLQEWLIQLETLGIPVVCIYQMVDAGGYWGLIDGGLSKKQAYQAVLDITVGSTRFVTSSGARKRITA
ncbi:MAG TPA: hypothetical protein VMR95_01430 [Candidatus Binatia bacterium]|nr:hypothetical protein [Candidatus Binatia bacterium]